MYPRVVTSRHNASYYRRAERRGYGHLAAEVLDEIDRDVDFRRYDTNPRDGVVDQIVLVIRHDEAASFTGVASLRGADAVQGSPPRPLDYDGVRVDWERSGLFLIHDRPGHIHSLSYYARLFAHEYGHHIWNSRGFFVGHLRAITTNDIPANGTERIGYVLMAGRGGGRDMRGDLLISPFERDLIGWLTPVEINDQPVQTIVLRDRYSTGDVLRLPLDDSDERSIDPILYLENRQRIGYFEQLRTHSAPGCTTYELGFLRTTGLLAMLGYPRPRAAAVDVLPADNTLDLSIENAAYEGDFYGPGSSIQITPWTTPSTSRPDGSPTWIAIDNVRYVSGGTDMAFELVRDFRARPIVRENSRVGPESDGAEITGQVWVGQGIALHVNRTEVLLSGGMRIDRDGSVAIGEDATVRIGGNTPLKLYRRATLSVAGTLDLQTSVDAHRTARIELLPGAQLLRPTGRTVAFQRMTLRL
jgi:hypothetical protein